MIDARTPPPDDAPTDDEPPFEHMYLRYATAIRNYLRARCGSGASADDLADDLAADAWLKAHLAWTTFSVRSRDGDHRSVERQRLAWLYRIATNVWLDHYRHARLVQWERGSALDQALAVVPASSIDEPETATLRADVRRQVWRAVAALRSPYRDVIEWQYGITSAGGRPTRQRELVDYPWLAKQLNVNTASAVKSLLWRARQALRADPELCALWEGQE